MAKKIIKKAATTTTKATTAAKKTDITNIEDLYSIIRDQYNATNEKKITKEEVSNVMAAFTSSFTSFAENSDADKATCILPGIGRFKVYVQAAHQATNPKTGEKIDVPAKKRLSFKPFPKFVDAINNK